MESSDAAKSPEKEDFTSETVKGTDLLREIYPGTRPDPRFLPLDQGGAFHYAPLDLYSEIARPGVYYSLVRRNGIIVAIAELQLHPHVANTLWFKAASVDESMKGLRYSERLLREVLGFARANHLTVQLSRYTHEGRERLRDKVIKLAGELEVPLIDRSVT
jgi:hypothetical protein